MEVFPKSWPCIETYGFEDHHFRNPPGFRLPYPAMKRFLVQVQAPQWRAPAQQRAAPQGLPWHLLSNMVCTPNWKITCGMGSSIVFMTMETKKACGVPQVKEIEGRWREHSLSIQQIPTGQSNRACFSPSTISLCTGIGLTGARDQGPIGSHRRATERPYEFDQSSIGSPTPNQDISRTVYN